MDINEVRAYHAQKEHLMRNEGKHPANKTHQEKLFEDAGKMDPTGIMSDESYIRGMDSSNPRRAQLMKEHNLKDDPNAPGVYGSSHQNY